MGKKSLRGGENKSQTPAALGSSELRGRALRHKETTRGLAVRSGRNCFDESDIREEDPE
jgi:hypothetical protein